MKLLFLFVLVLPVCYTKDWWENGNYYQIYPRSFKDSDGDGIGDLNGITEKLEYLKDIGITAAWLSPIFKSPMVDFGYDISDFYAIQPEYGTMEDFERLIKRAKELGIKIILDFVPNHASDENEWFQKSIESIEPYTNYFIWENATYDENGNRQPPSNWVSVFRYSAWEWNEKRQQYYLHQFAIQQPDFNFRNPAVVDEMKKVMNFWMDKGIDGFRIDSVPYIFEKEKDANGKYPDEPQTDDKSCTDPNDFCFLKHIYTKDQPENFDMIYQWREVCDDYQRRKGGETKILMTEAYSNLDILMLFYGNGKRNGAQIPFNFEFLARTNKNSNAIDFANVTDSWLTKMPAGAQANWVMGNHDNKRLATHYGIERADLFNIMLQTLPGNAITYNGEEIAMTDVHISWEDTIDPQACNGNKDTYESLSRDPVRTPFQWDSSKNSGFSNADKTWLPVAPNYKSNNVEMQLAADKSHLKVFKDAVAIRNEPSFQEGTYEKQTIGTDILVYKREKPGNDVFIVILNFGVTNYTIDLKQLYPSITEKVQIVTTSVQSKHEKSAIIPSRDFEAFGNVGTIVKVV